MAHCVRLFRRTLFGLPALLALYLAAGCASLTAPWTAPEVALLGVQPKLLGLDRQSFLVNLGVTNPNDRALPIKALSYRVQVEGQDLADGASELARLIPAGGTEQVDIEVNSNLLGLMPSLPGLLLTKNTLAWTVSGIAYVDAGGVRLPVPYRHSGTIAPAALLSGAVF
ncbi:LEA type 2 family protein [Thiocapsa marina]|uniref:Water Stress and Hypersensitive response domain-containing protein n=1 Tax=Thiocapsa marina 5811 TaxID=768671 RepID=F9UIN5_9GAMM|nr:LEA type 2 family protein [Thiocapsa marina]EGV15917.1 Water Stress and Hypersensitive response domain-containing protein [Thiocapsa marina 5811]